MSKLDDLFNNLSNEDGFFDNWKTSEYIFTTWEPKYSESHGYDNHIQGVVRFDLNSCSCDSKDWFLFIKLGSN